MSEPTVQFLTLATTDHWVELQTLMSEMGSAAPYWRTRSTSGALFPAGEGWHPDWHSQFRLGTYKYLEWCELMPRPDGDGLTLEDIVQACTAIGFEVALLADRVRLLGYRRLSPTPE